MCGRSDDQSGSGSDDLIMRLMIPVFNSLNVTWLEGIDDRDGMRDNISQLLPFVTWLNISPILPAVITWLRRAWQERSSGHQTWCRQVVFNNHNRF